MDVEPIFSISFPKKSMQRRRSVGPSSKAKQGTLPIHFHSKKNEPLQRKRPRSGLWESFPLKPTELTLSFNYERAFNFRKGHMKVRFCWKHSSLVYPLPLHVQLSPPKMVNSRGSRIFLACRWTHFCEGRQGKGKEVELRSALEASCKNNLA